MVNLMLFKGKNKYKQEIESNQNLKANTNELIITRTQTVLQSI